MTAQTQQQRPQAVQHKDLSTRPPSPVPAPALAAPVHFLQRSGLGPADFISNVQSTLAGGGSALAPHVRGDMESRFQRDFSNVRIHDDARAHDSARDAQAAAYAVGDHVVFGAGRYQPDISPGRHLLAHELAHTVQQGGVQYKSLDGMVLSEHAGLEREADRAADAVMHGRAPVPLSRVDLPHLSRAPENETFPEEDDPAATTAVKAAGLSYVGKISKAKMGKGAGIVVWVNEPLPVMPKGDGAWVDALWKQYSTGHNLVFRSELTSGKLPSIKEKSGVDYRGVWLNRYGFKDLKALGTSITGWLDENKEPLQTELEFAATNFAGNKLGGSKEANIDHIVEKQVGGASIPENMQIINADENQKSGIELNKYIVAQGNKVLDAVGRKGVSFISLRYEQVDYTSSKVTDAYDRIEFLLREGKLRPGPVGALATTGTGKPYSLQSGNATALIYVDPKAPKSTAIAEGGVNDSARRLISGLDLIDFVPAVTSGKKAASEKVNATIDAPRLNNAIRRAAGKNAHDTVELDALPGKASADPAGTATTAAAGAPSAAAAAPAGEVRELKISGKTKELDFFFPYLSPGKFTKMELAADNSFAAEGYIEPTLKFLKRLDVSLAKDSFKLKANLGPANFQPPFRGFKVTESSLSLQLAPEFKPSGDFKFQIGPEDKPYVLGAVTAGLDAAGFMVVGTLTAQNIPGVDSATGKVRYSQTEGWSGELKATSSKLPRTKKAEVTFGFRTVGGETQFYAGGGIQFDIGAGKDLSLTANYRGNRMVYAGTLVWEKPIKLVDKVELGFDYDGDELHGSGKTNITYKEKYKGELTVVYYRKGNAEARLSGKGKVDVKAGKAEGFLELAISPRGVVTGEGKVSYAFTDKIKPTVGVTLHPDGHLTLMGRIEITQPIQLFSQYPQGGGQRDLIKVNMDFIIPGPFPGLADPMVHLGAGVRFTYGVGPGQIVNTVIEGEFDPLEENKNIKLKFSSTFEIPGHVGLTGILEGGLGVAVLGGLLAKAHAGLRIEPGITLNLAARFPVTAEYVNGDFDFTGTAELTGGLRLTLAINLYAHVEAVAGALSDDFTYKIKDYNYDVGQQMVLTLAKIGYSTKTGFKAPSLNDVKITPDSIDPIEMIKKVANSAKSALAG